MAATNSKFLTEHGTVFYHTRGSSLAANVTIPYGTLAMNDAGVVKQAVTAVAGSGLLGVCLKDDGYVNGTGAALAGRYVFCRGLEVILMYDPNDPPVAADLGKAIAIKDNVTVKHTIAGDDLTVVLTEILSGNRCRVYLA